MGINRGGLFALILAPGPRRLACGDDDDAQRTETAGRAPATELRLGYFPNITHAPALIGIEKGIFAKALGTNVTLKTATFNAGPAAIEALFAGAIDATYIGPNPAINGFVKSKGEALRIIAGATSGGAVAGREAGASRSADDLKGKTLATPQLGNTQDVALRAWLKVEGPQDRQRPAAATSTINAAGERPDARHVQGRADRRRVGARAVGDAPRRRRAAARCSSTRRTCGPTASSSRRT